jgi:hypothetical protein
MLLLLQAHAAAAVVNFSEGCESDTMAPHLDALIAKLLTLLQQGKKIVQVDGAVLLVGAVCCWGLAPALFVVEALCRCWCCCATLLFLF